MPFLGCASNNRPTRISDPFLMVLFHLYMRVCVAILRHNAESSCMRARVTLQPTTVMHARYFFFFFLLTFFIYHDTK